LENVATLTAENERLAFDGADCKAKVELLEKMRDSFEDEAVNAKVEWANDHEAQ